MPTVHTGTLVRLYSRSSSIDTGSIILGDCKTRTQKSKRKTLIPFGVYSILVWLEEWWFWSCLMKSKRKRTKSPTINKEKPLHSNVTMKKELTPKANATDRLPPPPPSMQTPATPRPRRKRLASSRLSNEQIDQLAVPDLNCVEPNEKSVAPTALHANQNPFRGVTYIARSA